MPIRLIITLGRTDTVPISLVMQQAVTLAGMSSVARALPRTIAMMTFTEHQKVGVGRFIDPYEMRKEEDGRSIMDVLAGKGMRSNCTTFVNGVRSPPVASHPFVRRARDVEAVEYYRAGFAPAAFSAGGSGCVLIIWLRET